MAVLVTYSDPVQPQQELLKLRDTLSFTVRTQDGAVVYLVEDQVTSRYYHIGKREYTFMQAMDGRSTLVDVLSKVNLQLKEDALDEAEAKHIVFWLLRENLLINETGSPVLEPQGANKPKSLSRLLNLISFKIPLINPNQLLNYLTPKLEWMLGGGALIIWLLTLIMGAYHIVANWTAFTVASAGVLYVHNWLWLGGVYIVLKVLHELFHGLVCKKYGGEIYEAGIILILFMPIGYVDATSSWRFHHRWQRMHTAAAGMMIELFAAGLAAVVWSYSEPGLIKSLAYNVVIIAGISTVIFNANPLMRFDGYFIFADLINIPNLYSRGRQYVFYVLRKYILGQQTELQVLGNNKDYLVRIYGVTTLVWRLLIMVILLVGAWTLFYGAGMLITVLAMVLYFALPGLALIRYLKSEIKQQRLEGKQVILRLGAFVVVIFVFLTQITWSPSLTAPAIVKYAEINTIHARAPGFIKEVRVKNGQQVGQNDVLMVLENPEISGDSKRLDLRFQESKLRGRLLYQAEELSAWQAEQRQAEALKTQLQEKQQQQADLILQASRSGRVIGRHLMQMSGRYVKTGEKLLMVGDESKKEMRVSIAQNDVESFRAMAGGNIMVRLDDHLDSAFPATLERVEPRATVSVLNTELTALAGGVLPVQQQQDSDKSGYQYLQPRFQGIVRLSSEKSKTLFSGMTGKIKVSGVALSVYEHLTVTFQKWLSHLLLEKQKWA
jgi:putative peptide zinc metalloprotease protein